MSTALSGGAADEPPAGWLTQFRRGVGSGAAMLLIAIGCCALPAYLGWLMPGSDSTPASSALKVAVLLALSGAHGGVVVAGTPVSLSPMLVTGLLGWLVAAHARRAVSSSNFGGLVTGYAAASAVAAGWARLGSTHAPVLRSTVAAVLFVLLVGVAARTAGSIWARLSQRWRRVARTAGLISAGYLAAGALLAAGSLIAHFHQAVDVQTQLAPGAAGLPVSLLGIAATPNAVVAAVGYLTGPGFQLGSATSVSVFGVSHGRLPLFPLLAAVPHGALPTWLGLAVMAALAVLAGWLVRQSLPAVDPWPRRLADSAAVAALTAGSLAALAVLSSGGLGTGSLRGIGVRWWAIGAASMLVVLFGAALWLAFDVIRARSWAAAGSETEASVYSLNSERNPSAEQPAVTAAEPAARSRNAS